VRFLVDASVERRLATTLMNAGHDALTVGLDYPASLVDFDILRIAHEESRVLITNDTDFGELVFRLRIPHSGIVLMRLPRLSTREKGIRLMQAIDRHAGDLHRFVVIDPRGIRIR
jgi:predicted nuclease of predicted toxin-antitoxin system